MKHLDCDELSGKLANCGHQIVLVTRQESTVQGRCSALGHDVVLVAGFEHGQGGRVLQGTQDEPAGSAQMGQNLLRCTVFIPGACDLAESVQQLTHRTDVLTGPHVGIDSADGCRQADDRVLVVG